MKSEEFLLSLSLPSCSNQPASARQAGRKSTQISPLINRHTAPVLSLSTLLLSSPLCSLTPLLHALLISPPLPLSSPSPFISPAQSLLISFHLLYSISVSPFVLSKLPLQFPPLLSLPSPLYSALFTLSLLLSPPGFSSSFLPSSPPCSPPPLRRLS